MNVIAPRCKSAMDNLTRNLPPKFMTIKTAASLLKRNRPTFVEIEVASKNFPRKQIILPKKSKINSIFHLPKSAKKLDGEEPRTVLLNGSEVDPSNCVPNISEVFIYTCFDEEFRIEGSGVDEASVLDHGVGLSFTSVAQVEVGSIIFINFHGLGLLFGLHFFVLFLFFFVVHHPWVRHRFGGVRA